MTNYKPMNDSGALSLRRKKPAEPVKERTSLDLPDPAAYYRLALGRLDSTVELPDPQECAGSSYEAFRSRLFAETTMASPELNDPGTARQLDIMNQYRRRVSGEVASKRVRRSDFPAVRDFEEAEEITQPNNGETF